MARWRGLPWPAACRQAAGLVQSCPDGELDEVTARRVAAHLEECSRCGLEAATYAQIKTALAGRGTVPADAAGRLRRFGENLTAGDTIHAGNAAEARLP
jgi:hypothetical protein